MNEQQSSKQTSDNSNNEVLKLNKTATESLILAQDERWRHA